MPAHTPITSMPWKKTFPTCSVGLPPSTGYLPWRQGMHLVLLSPCPPPRWCMVLGVFQNYPSTGHTCAHAHESINTQIFMCWCWAHLSLLFQDKCVLWVWFSKATSPPQTLMLLQGIGSSPQLTLWKIQQSSVTWEVSSWNIETGYAAHAQSKLHSWRQDLLEIFKEKLQPSYFQRHLELNVSHF